MIEVATLVLTIMQVIVVIWSIVRGRRSRRELTMATVAMHHAVMESIRLMNEEADRIDARIATLRGEPHPAVIDRLSYPDAIPTSGREVTRGSTEMVHVPQNVKPENRARWEQGLMVATGVVVLVVFALVIFVPWFLWFHP